jgi:hypothetical protein
MRSIVSALRNQRKPNPIPVLPIGNWAGGIAAAQNYPDFTEA